MAVAIVARRLRLPYTVGLVATGLALALARLPLDLALTHDVLFEVILPPLLFEAALSISWRELNRDLTLVLALSTVGVLVGAGVVAGEHVWALNWPLPPALAFGALIAATDPIAVIAMLREAGVKGRLRLVIESESLFNDGAAALLFALILRPSPDGAPTPLAIVTQAALIGGGGIVVGAVVGALAIALAGRTDDHLVETALTAVASYGSFLIAERIGASGVLATVAAGLVMGNLGGLAAETGRFALSAQGRQSVVVFWEFAAFVANSLVFLLIGLAMADAATRGARVRRRRHRGRRPAGPRRSRRDGLSDGARLRPHALGVRLARSAVFSVVERAARRPGAGAGAGAAAHSALPRRNSRRRFRRRRVLGAGAGPHRRAVVARVATRTQQASRRRGVVGAIADRARRGQRPRLHALKHK